MLPVGYDIAGNLCALFYIDIVYKGTLIHVDCVALAGYRAANGKRCHFAAQVSIHMVSK